MRYVIKNEKLNDDVVELYLDYGSDGYIHLEAKDVNGFPWILLKISPDGKFSTVGSVDEKLGFEVDKNGELKIHKD